MSRNLHNEPRRVRLTADFICLEVGLAYRKGTILIRSPHSSQYMLEGTKLGQVCVSSFSRIRDICESVPEPNPKTT